MYVPLFIKALYINILVVLCLLTIIINCSETERMFLITEQLHVILSKIFDNL